MNVRALMISLAAFIQAIFLTSCGTVSVAGSPNQSIATGAKITVLAPSSDPQGIAGELEHRLLVEGFDVTSQIAGRTTLQYKEAEATEPGRRMTAGEVERRTTIPSNLVLRFQYRAYFDVFYWSFTRFNGTVVNLDNGSVIASVKFSGDKSVNSVLNDVVSKLSAMTK